MIDLKIGTITLSGVNGIIFDKDGTLIDSHIYWGAIIKKRALEVIEFYKLEDSIYEELCECMGFSNLQNRLLEKGPIALVSRDIVIDIVKEYLKLKGICSQESELSKIFDVVHRKFLVEMNDYICLLPSVYDFLLILKKNDIKTAIVTSDTAENTIRALNYLNIRHLFDEIIGKETVTESKITGEPVNEALRRLSLNACETICIGDSPVDLVMATTTKCLAGIGVATGQVTANELNKYSPYVVQTMEQLTVY